MSNNQSRYEFFYEQEKKAFEEMKKAIKISEDRIGLIKRDLHILHEDAPKFVDQSLAAPLYLKIDILQLALKGEYVRLRKALNKANSFLQGDDLDEE